MGIKQTDHVMQVTVLWPVTKAIMLLVAASLGNQSIGNVPHRKNPPPHTGHYSTEMLPRTKLQIKDITFAASFTF